MDDEEFFNIDPESSTAISGASSVAKENTLAKGKPAAAASAAAQDAAEKDNSFREYRKLCAEIAEESSSNGKTAILARYLEKGSTGCE